MVAGDGGRRRGIECTGDRGRTLDQCGVEDRNVDIRRFDQQRNLGALQNASLRALQGKTMDDVDEYAAAFIVEPVLNELAINDVVDRFLLGQGGMTTSMPYAAKRSR